MKRVVYSPLPVLTIHVDGGGFTVTASEGTASIDSSGRVTWYLESALYGEGGGAPTVFRNGQAVLPETIETPSGSSVRYSPPSGIPWSDGETVWGLFPSGMAFEVEYLRLPVATVHENGGVFTVTTDFGSATIDGDGVLVWDVSTAPAYSGLLRGATVYRNGLTVYPATVTATENAVAYDPGTMPLEGGEQLWGVYPHGATVTVDAWAGLAGRRLLGWDEARARLVAKLSPCAEPTLSAAEVDELLHRNQIARLWEPSTRYEAGDRVVPTTPTGLVYTPARNVGGNRYGGFSGEIEPEFPLNLKWPGGRWDGYWMDDFPANRRYAADGDMRWEVAGVEGPALWDIDRAACEGWLMKAAKASGEYHSYLAGVGGHPEQVFEHCQRMAERFRPIGIA